MAYFVYKNRNNAVIRVFEAPAPFLTAGWQLQDDQNTDEIVAAIAAYENAKAAAGDGGGGGSGGGTTTPPPPTVDLSSRADRTLSNLTDVPAARDALGLKGAALVEVGQHGGVASFDDPRLGDLVRTATTLLLFNSALVSGTAFTSGAFDRTTDPVAFDSTDLRATSDAPFTAVLQESADLTAWTTTHTYSVTNTAGVYATDEADLATTQRYSRLVLSATNGSMTKLFAEVDLVSGGGSNAATLAAARDRSTHTGTQLASTISDFTAAARTAAAPNVASKTANYTAVAGDNLWCDASAGTFTITLPTPAAGARSITVSKTDYTATPVVIAAPAGVFINDAATASLARSGNALTLTTDGTNYRGI